MKARAWIPAYLLILQLVAFALLSRSLAVPALLACVAVAGLSGRFRRTISSKTFPRLLLALMLIEAIKSRLFPLVVSGRISSLALDYSDAMALAEFLIAFQVLLLFIEMPGFPSVQWPLGIFAPLLATSALTFAAYFTGQPRDHRTALAAATLLTLLYAAHAGQSRESRGEASSRVRTALLAMFLAAALACGIGSSYYLSNNRLIFEQTFANLLLRARMPQTVGLSNRATLDGVNIEKTKDAQTVLLRAESERPPGYLRRIVYANFDGRSWIRPQAMRRTLKPLDTPPEAAHAALGDYDRFYPFTGSLSGTGLEVRVFPAKGLKGNLLTPLDMAWFAAPVSEIVIDSTGIIEPFERGWSGAYAFAPLTLPEPQDTPDPSVYLETPDNLKPEIAELARTITQGADTAEERIQAVLDYFAGYKYQLGLETLPGAKHVIAFDDTGYSPLEYFLLEKPAAHCEYFASGTAILLRLAGVPSRYVTGLYVQEYNAPGSYWVGRSGDAHAWTEAWVPGRGWITVDATPGGANPTSNPPGKVAQYTDCLKLFLGKLFDRLRTAFTEGVHLALLAWFKNSLPGRILLTLLLLGILWRAGLLRRVSWRRKRVSSPYIPLHHLLRRMDRQCRRKGLVRLPSETLHQFAQRIIESETDPEWRQSAADWYRAYALARYNPRPPEGSLEDLTTRIPAGK